MSTTPRPAEKSSTAESESLTAETHPTREEIELRAYQIYVERGGAHGHDVDDWLASGSDELCREIREHSGGWRKAATG